MCLGASPSYFTSLGYQRLHELSVRWVTKAYIFLKPLIMWFSRSVMSSSLKHHELQHTRLPCPSPNPRDCLHSCHSSWWCHATIPSSVFPFSSCLHLPQHQGLFQWASSFLENMKLAKVACKCCLKLQFTWRYTFIESTVSQLGTKVVRVTQFQLMKNKYSLKKNTWNKNNLKGLEKRQEIEILIIENKRFITWEIL